MTIEIDEVLRLEQRNIELIKSIKLINAYHPFLRKKYYTVLEHQISLLLQYTNIINDFYNTIEEL